MAISSLTTNLLILAAFVAVVLAALRIAQSIFKTDTMRGAATEMAAKLVAYPTGSPGVLRRRFVRALTSQHLIMPSGERLAFGELTVRLAPEDLERLDPDGDVDRLGADGAKLYLAHAKRSGWSIPAEVSVQVEIDPGLRSGWIPPARAVRAESSWLPETGSVEVPRADHRPRIGWEVLTEDTADAERAGDSPTPLRSVPAAPEPAAEPAPTELFSAVADDDDVPTMNAVGDLRLRRGSDVVVVPRQGTAYLGRLGRSLLRFSEPEVSGRHAALRYHRGRWEVRDLGSTNGTRLDGEPVSQDDWTPVRSGSVLALAGVRVDVLMETTGTVNLEDVTTR